RSAGGRPMTAVTTRRPVDDRRPAGRFPAARPARGRALTRFARRLPGRLLTLVLLIVVIYPLAWLFLGSLKSQSDYLNSPSYSLPADWMRGNSKAAWVTGELGIYIRNSVTAVLPALALVIVGGSAAGFALQVMRWRLSRPVMLLFLAGIMVPSQM